MMGERIRAARWFINALRRCEQPRYSFEHAVVNLLLGVACLILTALGELRLWLLFISVLFISLGVHGLRAWWFIRKRNREHEEYLRQRMREDGDA